MQVDEAADAAAKTVRNERKMQRADQLQQHQAQRDGAGEGTIAVNALGHFAEGRYP